jgi:hypothetical protein
MACADFYEFLVEFAFCLYLLGPLSKTCEEKGSTQLDSFIRKNVAGNTVMGSHLLESLKHYHSKSNPTSRTTYAGSRRRTKDGTVGWKTTG